DNIDAVKSSKASKEPTKHPDFQHVDKEDQDLLLQAGAAKASSTNIVNTASTPVSTDSPYDRLSFTNLTNADQDDSEIPALEEIYNNPTNGIFTHASYDDEGAVADFINLELAVNVSPIPTSRINFIHPSTQILRDPQSAVQTRSKVTKSFGAHAFVSYIQKQRRNNHKDFQHCLFACFLSQNEPKKIFEALEEESWVDAMQEELLQFKILKVWILVDFPYGKKLVAQGHRQEEGIYYDEVFAPVARIEARIEAIRSLLRPLPLYINPKADIMFVGNPQQEIVISGRETYSWQLQKATIHDTSTTDAEYVAESFMRLLTFLREAPFTMLSLYITAKVAGKPVSISEASIRSDLLFDDADGIDSLPNQAIFDAIQLMGLQITPKEIKHLEGHISRELKKKPNLLSHTPLVAWMNSVLHEAKIRQGKEILKDRGRSKGVNDTLGLYGVLRCSKDVGRTRNVDILKDSTDKEKDSTDKEKDSTRRQSTDFDDIKARMEADRLLALRLQEERERESSSLWKREQNSFMIQLQLKEGYKEKGVWGGHIKMIARKRKRPQPDVDNNDKHRECLKIVTFEGTIDSEIMERKSVIARLNKVSSPDGDYLVIYRANGNFRAFNCLLEELHIFDRQDLFHLYDLVMEQYSEITLEGIELILWGDLKIMMESSTEENDQSDF
ncbi:hypothetical protein Tco_1188324, partial [Tanacetum coccineum]